MLAVNKLFNLLTSSCSIILFTSSVFLFCFASSFIFYFSFSPHHYSPSSSTLSLPISLLSFFLQDEDVNSKTCTFKITHREFANQHWYHCHTCSLINHSGVCSVCAKVCHKVSAAAWTLVARAAAAAWQRCWLMQRMCGGKGNAFSVSAENR